MPDLLLELFSEEIPARMQEDAANDLANSIQKALEDSGYPGVEQYVDSAEIFVSPRHLVVWIKNLTTEQPDISIERKGPKVGAPQAAIDGFLKSTGLALDQLEVRNEVYFANIHRKGTPTSILLKSVIEKTLAEFPWPKSMRWGSGEQSWVRPLRSILCIFDGKVVPVEFAGVKAGNVTYGHHFLAPKAITVKKADDYEALLEKAFVIADREKRKAKILELANAAAAKHSLSLKKDENLLGEVTGLVEWPVVLVGKIDAQFMDLPPEVLVSEMRGHQKYFALEKNGKLAPHFLITANMETGDKGAAITAGNERVLRARLADGRFFWDQDRKKRLEEWAAGLKNVTFHAKLGSVADKVERVKTLALGVMPHVDPGLRRDDVERAATLCKADLVTGMVGEFPELQGVMGRYYALHQSESASVVDAIRDHYKPLGPSDAVPAAPVSICIALADKLDTLIRMFSINEKPTGSKDPFALRRAALGIIRIILENKIQISLDKIFNDEILDAIWIHKEGHHWATAEAMNWTTKEMRDKNSPLIIKRTTDSLQVSESGLATVFSLDEINRKNASLRKELLAFFIDRLKVQLKDSGIRHDVISAVVGGDDDLVRIVARARALQDFLATDDGANLLAAYKRAANIVVIEEKKDKTAYSQPVNPALLQSPEEQALNQALAHVVSGVAPLLKQEQFAQAMSALSKLRAPVDRFFERVLVNDKDAGVRTNRLNLLAQLRSTLDTIADFALIEG